MTDIVVRVMDCHVFRLVDNEPIYLLLKQSPEQIYPVIWQCVTGKIEAGEKPHETALRELNEETGLTPLSMWTIDQVNHYYDPKYDKVFLIPVFGIEVQTKDVKLSTEHIDYYWGSKEKVKEKMLWNQQKLGLENFYQMLTKNTKKLELSEISI